MKLRTFQGRTMAEALGRVKQTFGKDAVVLSTRTANHGGLLGLGGGSWVEITAARDISDLPPALRQGTLRVRSGNPVKANGAADSVNVPRTTVAVPQNIAGELNALKSLVAELVHQSRRTNAPPVPSELLDSYQRLVQNSVAEELAASLVDRVRATLGPRQLRDPVLVCGRIAELLEPMVPTAGGIAFRDRQDRPTVIALVGPTGVGKTTTVAKLAAQYSLREHRRVGLITIDTYRIAAVEQLRTYAQIMGVPLAVAATPIQLANAVREMQDRDVILVDTAGRGQRDAARIEELKQFFLAHRPDELHLVLASTASEPVLHQAIEKFSPLGIDRLIFSKLDEALGFGVILSCLRKANAKLSYVTTGQDVPDDIEIGSGHRMARWIVNGVLDVPDRRAGEPVEAG